ncbi:carboxypeptidase M32 [Loktanella sp. D2R18]|uniref:carboxypeptidase M32 n=1 Tax=Rhodobacterales TaxID=204455 RepID=UPI000DE96797|nr:MULTISPECIES: carboxypeptidase M32 [Rhodobacterales]MDO6591599.1 carboxypeptidase M32 [Yoonia sp. 1_MG-2023]RBW43715.1 carboxypeptidase M32 [Loktanella sp. D2R18]
MTAYDDLMQFQRETEALGQIAGRLGWDQETMMPEGATPQRAEEHGAMANILHARRTDPRVGDWLAQAESADDIAAANLRHIKRNFERTAKVPASLAAELAKTTSLAHRTWAQARADEDVASFLPMLQKVVDLRKQEASAIAGNSDPYDALLDDYEPGATGASLGAMFDALRPRLVDLRAAILDRPAPAQLSGSFDEAAQLALSEKLALAFGYDLGNGRIDKAVHPFSSGSGLDVRITTRTNPTDPFNCFYSTIHEVGHAAYEQGIDHQHLLTPIGAGVSMGVHESQSRIYENQLGRSRAFTGWVYGQMRDAFGDFGIADEDAFYATVNRVSDGFIRTEADEVQYNLHVLLRFDLERALMAGDLAVNDLEAAWNDRFKADFGYAVDRPSNGVLQDVHWSEGLFGYFPTYTLGNVYAGCLNAKLRKAVPDLDDDLAQGDTSAATSWLRENLQQFGGLRTPTDTIAYATGTMPSEAPLLDYLEEKFRGIYGL